MADDEPLPPGWQKQFAPARNKFYYWHESNPTQTTTWTRPPNPAPSPLNQVSPSAPSPLNQGNPSAAPSPIVCSKSDVYPAMTYIGWEKPGSNTKALLSKFCEEAGKTAGDILSHLQARHQPFHPKRRPTDPVAIVWEDSWSSTEAKSRDPLGELLITQLGDELRKKGLKFNDPFFPAGVSSLLVYPETVKARTAASSAGKRQDLIPFLEWLDLEKNVSWKRPSELYPGQNVKVWGDNISPDDVRQGNLGNCCKILPALRDYLGLIPLFTDYLSAVAACANSTNDVLLRDLLVEDYADVGLYGVKFFVMGRWVTLAVDDKIPLADLNSKGRPLARPEILFARPKQESGYIEIWPLIFEKAWAKLHGSYECTDAGENHDALQYLTGGVIKKVDVKKNAPTDWATITDLLNEKDDGDAFVGCGEVGWSFSAYKKEEAEKVGLVSGHAYALLRAIEPKPGLRLVEVQNPWGSTEWKGKFNDKDPLLRQVLGDGVVAKDDGTFYMEWADFIKWFGQCRCVDPRCFNRKSEDGLARIDGAAGNWVAGKTAGGKVENVSFPFNPRFELTGSTGEVTLTLYQPDTRHLAIYDADSMQGPFGSSLYFGEKGSSRPMKVVNFIEANERLFTSTVPLQIEQGKTYEIVTTAERAGQEGTFAFTVCGKNAELKACPFKTPPPAVAAAMSRSGGRPWRGPNGETLEKFGVI